MNEYKLKAKDGEEVIVYEGRGNFYDGISELPPRVPCASASELAGIRLLVPRTHPLWRNDIWAAENYNYFPNGDIIITSRDYNPIINYAKKFVTPIDPGWFYLDIKTINRLRDIAKEDVSEAIKSGALLVPRKKVEEYFPTKSLADETVPYFLFRGNAVEYGNRLFDEGLAVIKQEVYHTYPTNKEIFGSNVSRYFSTNKGPFGRTLSICRFISGLFDGNHSITPVAGCFFGEVAGGLVLGVQSKRKKTNKVVPTKSTIEEKV